MASPRPTTLKAALALSSGALIFLFSLAFTLWAIKTSESDLRASVMDAQRTLLRSTAADIEAKIDLRLDALTTIAPLLSRAAPAPGPAMDAFFAPRPVMKKIFDAVIVLNAQGQVVYDLPSGAAASTSGLALGDRDFFKKLMAGAPVVVSSPLRAGEGAEPAIVFAAPLRAPDGAIHGALLGALHASHGNFLGELGQIRIGREGYFAIVQNTPEPLYVMHRQAERVMTAPQAAAVSAILAAARKSEEGTTRGLDEQGAESLLSFKALRALPWVLIGSYPANEAFTVLRQRQQEALAFGAGLFLLATALTWINTAWLLRPLLRLKDIMERQAADPSLPMPAENFGSAELAALVRAYKAQAAKRMEFEERLRANERRLHELMDNIPARVAYIDKQERYFFVNEHRGRGFSGDPHTLLGRSLRESRSAASYAKIENYVRRTLAGETLSFELEETVAGQECHFQVSYVPDRDELGGIQGFFMMAFDITDLKRAQQRLEQLAHLDTLTGLPNRFLLNEVLPQALRRSARSGKALALMFIDIDHFKQINDLHGHATGDAVLKEFAGRLTDAVRTTDTVARLAGDEFVVVIEALHDEGEAALVATKVMAAMERAFAIGNEALSVAASLGIAFHRGAQVSGEELLAQADVALYLAKGAGRKAWRLLVVEASANRSLTSIQD